jgi:hypothetical protein
MSPTLCLAEGRDAALWAHVVKYTNVPPTFGGFKLNTTQWDIALRGEAANTSLLSVGFAPGPIGMSLVVGRNLPALLRDATSMFLAAPFNASAERAV